MLLRIFLLLTIAVTMSQRVSAAKAFREWSQFRQTDGSRLDVQLVGDEYFHYYIATDGAILVHDGSSLYLADQDSDGNLVSSRILAHAPGQRALAETMAVMRQDRETMVAKGMEKASRQRLATRASSLPALFPAIGSPRAVVIMVEFSDLQFRLPDAFGQFDNSLNGKGTNPDHVMYENFGSVNQYFSDMSGGRYSPQFDLYGPYRLSESYKTYGRGRDNITALLKASCQAADADVDFSQYDADGDGYADLVYIIYAGYGENYASNSSDYIWPQSGHISSTPVFDGVKICRYGVSNELHGSENNQANIGYKMSGIGLFCHEFCHTLGLPDLYPTSGYASECCDVGLGYYGLMDLGEYTFNGYRPTALTCWERERLGWITVPELYQSQDVMLTTAERGGGSYKISNPVNPAECYMLEVVENSSDLWNGKIFGRGLVIYHIDFDDYAFKIAGLGGNNLNNTIGHPRFSLVAADGLMLSDYYLKTTVTNSVWTDVNTVNAELLRRYGGQYIDNATYKEEAAGDPFPGVRGVTSFTDYSPLPAFWYSGGGIEKPLTDITEVSASSVSFKFMGGSASVEGVEADASSPAACYGLDGRRVPKGQGRGVLIYTRSENPRSDTHHRAPALNSKRIVVTHTP